MKKMLALVAGCLLAASAARPALAVVLGGGPEASDCYVTFDGISAANGRTAECRDGSACDADGQKNRQCRFAVSVCVKQTSAGCDSSAVTVRAIRGARRQLPNRPATPAITPSCAPNEVDVKLKSAGRKPGKRLIHTLALTDGDPRKDADQFTLKCLPGSPSGAFLD
jgi:hypothetical protein